MAYRIAIVGHAADKFTPDTEQVAREWCARILAWHPEFESGNLTVVSGGCHLGGVDLFAEAAADERGIRKEIYLPVRHVWSGGYKERNLQIAESCNEAWCIVVSSYPEDYEGLIHGTREAPFCYHCQKLRPTHVKSGGCWTVKQASRLDKPARWVIIDAHTLEAQVV